MIWKENKFSVWHFLHILQTPVKSQKWKEYTQISIENRTSPSTELQLRKGIQDKASEIAHMNPHAHVHTFMIGRVKIEKICVLS